METSIIVDFYNMRCSCCKVRIHDKLATKCETCDTKFGGVISNHVGLADKLREERGDLLKGDGDIGDKYPDLVGG
tara:strand:+ start:118 stop:342 length:225 start_codon:yes stop_codon:yes gene_type:complete